MSLPGIGDWVAACVGDSPECYGKAPIIDQLSTAGIYAINQIDNIEAPAADMTPSSPVQRFSLDL